MMIKSGDYRLAKKGVDFISSNFINRYRCKFRIVLMLILIIPVTVNCSSIKLPGFGKKNDLKSISIEAQSDANSNTPVAVDILFVNGDNLLSLLSAMDGPKWFSQKKELMLRYSSQISVVSYEIVPMSFIDSIAMPKESEYASNILLFANYIAANGQYISELTTYEHLKIQLQRTQYVLSEHDK